MRLAIRNICSEYDSYRAARVKSLFNVESGANFSLDADLDIDDGKWGLGVVVGPSGSGKSSIGRKIFPGVEIHDPNGGWSADKPIVDDIGAGQDFNDVTGALAAVGLGSVPSWLRPFGVLSNGEKFRADLARVICQNPERIVIDEFTSVVDRQIAKVGAGAFSKAWKRTGNKCVLLSCHYDILDWAEPDWVFDTSTGKFQRGLLWRRPKIKLEILKTDKRYWHLFEPHYYLKLPSMVAAEYFVGLVDGEPVCHLAVAPFFHGGYYRASRMVVMPEWQGAGVGTKFLNGICELHLQGGGRQGKKFRTIFHTSHPGLAAALRRDKRWVQTSAVTHGGNKKSSAKSLRRSARKAGSKQGGSGGGYGGHFRAVQGFKYIGDRGFLKPAVAAPVPGPVQTAAQAVAHGP
jgi:energy-coupling factor transporter ATP-binding protein EcfA2